MLARLAEGERIVFLDVRWKLGDPHGRQHYLGGHLPGAVYIDLETELARHGEPRDGRHPLPSADDFQASVRSWGVNEGDTVVVYDAAGNLAAARLWWLLRHGGFGSVSVLDGGLAAWKAADGPLESGPVDPVPGTVTLGWDQMPVISLEQAADWSTHGVLLDARAAERYAGDTEPIDPRAGHIPGASSAPTTENLAADSRFLSPELLRARFSGLGIGPDSEVAAYCGSGVTAAHEVLALSLAGIEAALFPGSWSAWSNHPELPVATGTGAFDVGAESTAAHPVG